MKGKASVILLFFVLIVGLSLLLYPSISDYWNSLHQSRAVSSYAEDAANLDEERYAELLDAARAYNESLSDKENRYLITDAEKAAYNELLNLSGNGVMGYIEIPEIGCSLPIYHGVDESVLQIAIGHIEWSSLPIGGEGTHAVVSGHRGLPSARLFTDIDKLAEGDVFIIRVLNETVTYEVDQILIVEPHQLDALVIEEGKDYCTLITCTPYGINTHRLLVRGHRVENAAEAKAIRVTADATQIDPILMSPVIAAPILLLLFLWLMLSEPKKEAPRPFIDDILDDE